MALIGRDLPIVSLSHQYLVTEEIPELAARATPLPLLRDPDVSYYLRQERNGYILGPYEWQATPMWLDGIPDEFANMLWPADLDRLEKQILDAGERVPVLADAGITRVINGPIPYSPDGYPYLGPERGLRNFFHCNTFSFGIAQGGGAGMAIADWIIDGQPPFDIWSVDRRRFKEYATFDYTVAKAVEVYQNEYAVGFPFEERPAGRPAYTSPLYDDAVGQGCGLRRARWLGATRLCRHRRSRRRPHADAVPDQRLASSRGRRSRRCSQPGRPARPSRLHQVRDPRPRRDELSRRAGVLEAAAARSPRPRRTR